MTAHGISRRDPVTPAEREAFSRTARPVRSRTAERTRGLRPQKPPTPAERAALDALRWLCVQGDWERARKVAERTGQSEQGAAQTLASCVRKGLVKRTAGRGHVWFALTGKGWRLATPRTEQHRRRRDAR